jgi:hypothetical protein
MAKKIRKRKGIMEKNLFGCMFATTKTRPTVKTRFASKVAMF